MELLKNFMYAGVGLASVTADKTKDTIDDLVEKGMISDTEGKKIIENFLESTNETRKDFETKLKTTGEKITSKFDFLNKDKEINELQNKIKELEVALAKANKRAKTTTSTKTKDPAPITSAGRS